jgi:hypothetical protein
MSLFTTLENRLAVPLLEITLSAQNQEVDAFSLDFVYFSAPTHKINLKNTRFCVIKK